MVKDLHELEIELAELKAFNKLMIMLTIMGWFMVLVTALYVLIQISLIPQKDAEAIDAILNQYQINGN